MKSWHVAVSTAVIALCEMKIRAFMMGVNYVSVNRCLLLISAAALGAVHVSMTCVV